jgi:uncharacterized protein YciI
MLFVWLGFLNEGAEPSQEVQEQVTAFLQQPFITIRAAGALRDGDSKRAGMMMVFEAQNRAAAEALANNSPMLRAGLYREHHLYEYHNEVG